MVPEIDNSANIVDSTIGDTEIREYVTVHDSEIGDGCRIYERSSLKKSEVKDDVDINAGTYVENAHIRNNVQIGPNCNVVGVTHELHKDGMKFRDDVFEQIDLQSGVFIGAGVTLTPGVEIGEGTVISAGVTVTDDIGPEKIVIGSPPSQEIFDLGEWVDR